LYGAYGEEPASPAATPPARTNLQKPCRRVTLDDAKHSFSHESIPGHSNLELSQITLYIIFNIHRFDGEELVVGCGDPLVAVLTGRGTCQYCGNEVFSTPDTRLALSRRRSAKRSESVRGVMHVGFPRPSLSRMLEVLVLLKNLQIQ
jgi:hypothetical protein